MLLGVAGDVDGTGAGAKIEATVHSSTAKVAIGLGQKIIFFIFSNTVFHPPFPPPTTSTPPVLLTTSVFAPPRRFAALGSSPFLLKCRRRARSI